MYFILKFNIQIIRTHNNWDPENPPGTNQGAQQLRHVHAGQKSSENDRTDADNMQQIPQRTLITI